MDGKERFELLNDNFIYDRKLKEYVASPSASMKHYMGTLTDLLNQQDKENKHLANLHDELNRRYCCQQDELIIVKEENKSLKETVNHYKGTTLGVFADEIRQLKQSQIQFTINVLEDIMSHCRNGISDYWSLHYVCTIIENKIKSLKNFDNKQSEGSKW